MSRNSGHDDNDDVYNLGDVSENSEAGGDADEGARFNEATVVRPRSVLDDAFDAHTVVRPESARRSSPTPATPPPATPRASQPPPTPSSTPTPSAASQTPPPSMQARTVKDAVTSPSISKRFRRDASVTNFPIPPAIHIELPGDEPKDKPENKPENKPAGPTPAQIAEAQAVAQAQENARQKAEQAAKQAAAQEAARRAQQQQEQQQKAAAAAAAQKAEAEAKQEAARRERQAAQASPPPVSENAGQFRFEETQSNFKLEPARRKLDFKIVAAVVVVAVVGAYMVFGGAGSEPGNGKPKVEASNVSGQKDFASTAPAPVAHDGSLDGTRQAASELASPPPAAAATAGPTASVLSGFDDAFSRTQGRSRPDSRD